MVRFASAIFILLIILTSCALMPVETQTQEASFTVASSAKHTIPIEVRSGQSIEGYFSVTGRENYIDFYIKDPAGGLAYGVVRAQGSHSFQAQAKITGLHTLYFDNSISFGSSREISVHYQVR